MEIDLNTRKGFSRGYLFGLLKPEKLKELEAVLNGSSPYCLAFQQGVKAGKLKSLEKKNTKSQKKGKEDPGKIGF